jgi:hypothetical protein
MGNPTPDYLLKRDQEIRDRLTAAAEAEQKRNETESKESIIKNVDSIDSDKSTTQSK